MERHGWEYMTLRLWSQEGLGLDLGRAGYPHFYYLYKKIRVQACSLKSLSPQ